MANYTKTDILTERLLLLPVDWDENDLLLKSGSTLYIYKVFSYLYAKSIMNSNEAYSKH